MNSFLRHFWKKIFRRNWIFGLVLIFLFGIPRFYLVLNANVSGSFNSVSIIFVLMWIAPWVFLTRTGRRQIGLCTPSKPSWIFYSFILGILGASVLHIIGLGLFDTTVSNWFAYIAESYKLNIGEINPSDKMIYFIIFSIIGMTFSPIGEELLYRGIIHRSLYEKLGDRNASIADSAAFGLTHLAHFGIVYTAGAWKFLPFPSILWIILIFSTGILFSVCKHKTGSILGAIICHAGFNLAMMYYIFYHIL